MLIICRRHCQPIQGIPISSRELGVARSVFDAQWFVKQAFMLLPQRDVWRVVDPPRIFFPAVMCGEAAHYGGKRIHCGEGCTFPTPFCVSSIKSVPKTAACAHPAG